MRWIDKFNSDARERRISALVDRIMETALVEAFAMEGELSEIVLALDRARALAKDIARKRHDGAEGERRLKQLKAWLSA